MVKRLYGYLKVVGEAYLYSGLFAQAVSRDSGKSRCSKNSKDGARDTKWKRFSFNAECAPLDVPDITVPPPAWTWARFNESKLKPPAEVWRHFLQLCVLQEVNSGLSWIMASINVLKSRFYSYVTMYSQEQREQSFVDWPFREECNCTPEKVRQINLFWKFTS